MFDELNKELMEVKEKVRMRRKLEGNLVSARNVLMDEKAKLGKFKRELEKENADVEKLQGMGVTALFYAVLGNKERQMDKERQEYLAAKLKYDECSDSVRAIQDEIYTMEKQISEIGDVDMQYKELMEKKEKAIMEAANEAAVRLTHLSEEMADIRSDIKELGEAISAGSSVVSKLNSVINSLESAGNWGTWDMLGGGFFATAAKHSRMDEARDYAHDVQQLLRRFQRELADVNMNAGSEVVLEIGSFEKFADYFFDGLISDWIVQSKIRDSLSNAVSMKDRISGLVRTLEGREKTARIKLETVSRERQELVESMKF